MMVTSLRAEGLHIETWSGIAAFTLTWATAFSDKQEGPPGALSGGGAAVECNAGDHSCETASKHGVSQTSTPGHGLLDGSMFEWPAGCVVSLADRLAIDAARQSKH